MVGRALWILILACTTFGGSVYAVGPYHSMGGYNQNGFGSAGNEENSSSEQSSRLGQCMKDAAAEAWNSTKELGGNAWECINHPIDCGRKAVDAVRNMWNFVKDLRNQLEQVWNTITNLTEDMKWKLGCGVIGTVGVDALLAVLTGVGASKVAATVSKLVLKLPKLAKLAKLSAIAHLSDKMLDLSDHAIEMIQKLMDKGKENLVKKALACGL